MERELLVSRIQTPDGTILTSQHRHDYVTYVDANGYEYMLDGGSDYQRINVNPIPCIDVSIYTDSPYEEIRKYFCRGGYGKNGDEPLRQVPLCEMSNEWLKNCIIYNFKHGCGIFCKTNSYYMRELIYRQDNDIIIED